jgi:hypothetical protein
MVPEGEAVDQDESGTVENGTGTAKSVARSGGAERRGRPQRPNRTSNAGAAVLALTVCSRCSYFVAGYRLIHDDLETAAAGLQDGWLELTGDELTRQLAAVSYGIHPENEIYFYSGCCRECRRVFTFQHEPDSDQPGTMRFKIDAA